MSNTALKVANEPSRIDFLFDKQRQASRSQAGAYPSLQERLAHLDTLEQLLESNQDAICEAINRDFGNRCAQETKLAEISMLLGNIAYVKKHLKGWVKPQKRHVGLGFLGAKNQVIPQPKGVIGVVAPWNYPLQLTVGPAIFALAAGNRVIIKMAANSQNLCRLMDELTAKVFDESVLAFVPGVSAGEFTARPWDHLVFTGSPETGKTVMETAARYLTPVTLELGGKSPTIVAPDFDLRTAAERMLFGKLLNAGQTCTAPDYLFLPRGSVDEFIGHAKAIVAERYGRADSGDYTSIIDGKAFSRLCSTLEDATAKGAKTVPLTQGDTPNPETRKLPPQIVLDVTAEMVIMQDEIFGPLLPIKPYDSIDEVIDYINANERPLALYLFSNNKALQEKVVYNTVSGGVSVNDTLLHVAQHDMPFGGIGNSGMGHYHGKEGFIEFSKLRPVFKQARNSGILMLAPPYGPRFEKLMKLMIRFRL
ncbi:coniferyl aldehyde dehydrogenase [Aestuariirhabdus litorea]|uniref:Aldehyde dehydrogenase n=1 Tax=Aestuariirhabdus litorea TaxID=2528527 RepID=A0A3P3VR02_9GAMM|nr:coniferyl aldehyde dehydrogenase [Aestuariirhabdus litorea]RRJ84398.1 coniferyl aldehyde dehydrogenase [Aestuariirhabdus litorea]RWW97622.1 aldehyde dehydrogenase family protein [Endozoicomonadaceae bacterium GTF-13]